MRIKSLVIHNFKNYSGTIEFDLDRDITILYGENGFGKSSFFDALEWGLTGKISRFDDYNQDQDFNDIYIINSYVKSIDQIAECYVKLTFDNYELIRKITLNSDTTRTSVELKCLKTSETINGKQNVEVKLKSIFMPDVGNTSFNIKQPYILSQDQVTDFILKDKPKERYKALANLVGLEKIINLSHNVRLIKRELNIKKEKLENIIKTKQEIIDSVSPIKNISKDELLKKATKVIPLNEEISNYSIHLKELQKNINLSIFSETDFMEKISRYKDDKRSIQDLIGEKSHTELSIQRLEEHIKFLNTSQLSLQAKISDLELYKENQDKLDSCLKQRKEIENKIQLVKFELKLLLGSESTLELKEIDDKINAFSDTKAIFNYNLTYYEEFNNNKHLESDTISFLDSYIFNKEKYSKKILRKRRWLEKVTALLFANEINSQQTTLYELISNIKDYLKLNKEESICPVCSSDLNGGLITNIDQNRFSLENEIKKGTEKFERVLELKQRLEFEIGLLDKSIKELEIDFLNKKHFLVNIQNNIRNITSNSMFRENLMVGNKETLNSDITKLNSKLETLNVAKNHQINISSLENQKITFEITIDNLKKTLKNKEYSNVEKFNARLKKRNTYLVQVKSVLLDNKKLYKERSIDVEILLGYKVDLVRPLSSLYNECVLNISNLKKRLAEVEVFNGEYLEYEKNRNIIKIQEGASKEKGAAKLKLHYIQNNIDELERYVEEINKTIGLEALSFLNKENSTVQQLYRYLNPMVSSKGLKFIAEDEGLTIKISDKISNINNEVNAQYVLSSGQLNVLALSIFLAVNNSTNTNLNLIAIDDPIQNMDDINQFSVCDILSNLNRQLVFSTHDLDFIKLFTKKNEHLDGSIQVYILKKPKINKNEDIDHIVFETADQIVFETTEFY